MIFNVKITICCIDSESLLFFFIPRKLRPQCFVGNCCFVEPPTGILLEEKHYPKEVGFFGSLAFHFFVHFDKDKSCCPESKSRSIRLV